ncbi:TonB-dependent receptor [Galbibacter sp. EGI 63066]|uniref:SusC/RagA family TonB-linked outer membrane protein n=1 Tax=Galbibacter sp. EGI 63066 TaxID=2993559 RepID=UPI002248FE87|nr:TonB-dependent receptor [Galbibacter sp. EGI 63066]MCX2679905.1 TonB-dependent receptor [Galbibacter sp. EGI 63066]
MKILQKLNLLLFLIPLGVFAQQTVSGVVTEAATGTPIPGVNVLVKGSTTGTTTDFDGAYEINANDGDVLQFSYIGFTTTEKVVAGSTMNVALQEDTQQLEEVVVIGYGSVKKEDLTGTTDLVTSEDFNKGPIVSAQSLISGRVAGVNVTSGSGAPGDGQEITIRGMGSLSLTSSPLIVVDGIPLDNSGVGGTRNPLNFINPNDIESFVVLKDASSTAIYGSRGANGVILITTKKGKKHEFEFNASSQTTIYNVTETVDVLEADRFRELVLSLDNPDAAARMGNANTDWQDEIYTFAVGQDHNVSALGSAFGIPMRVSAGFSNHEGILKGDEFSRGTASINLTPRLMDDHLKLELNARGMYIENTFADRGAIGSAIQFDPTQSVFDENSPFGYYAWLNPDGVTQNSQAPTNPVALLDLIDDSAEVRRFVVNGKVDYKLHFFPDLTATVNVGIDKSNSNGRRIVSELMPTSDMLWNGSLNRYSNISTNLLFDAYATYTKTLNDTHNISFVAGHSYQSFEYDNESYDSEAQEDGLKYEFIDKSKNVLLSYFGRLNYDYKGKYLLTASFRADASSKLNPEDRWGYFPSVALAWKISDESFMEDSAFNLLKLRVGYGEIANVNGLGDYLFLTRYTGSTDSARYQLGNSFYQTYRPEPINENLRWEVGKTFNVGLDYSLFDGRVSGLVNAYIRNTEDLIASSLVDPFTNFGNRIDANIGNMENRGIEFNINVDAIRRDDFNLSLNYNISYNDNEITKLSVDQPTGGISSGVGNFAQVHRVGEEAASFLVYQQVYDETGKPIEGVYVDRNEDGMINDQDKYIFNSPNADIFMGFNINANYKKWDFSAQTRASLGNYMYNDVFAGRGILAGVTDLSMLDNIHADYFNTGFENYSDPNALSDHFVQEASFFKIDNISLGYTLDQAIENTSIRIYSSLQNVLTVTDYDGLDPEIDGGIDNNFYPRPRSFVLGVNVDF